MADINPKVMEMVESELKSDPDISNPQLLEKARKIDPSVDELSPRQFNARYPLQVKRALKPRKPRKRKAKKSRGQTARRSGSGSKADASRDKVRSVLLELARDVADAQGKGELVDVVAGIDRYVDRVVKA